MHVSAKEQLASLLKILPDVKKIGLMSDPSMTAGLVKQCEQAASEAGIELFVAQVSTPKDVPEAMGRIKKDIDVFWMIPDLTVLTPETIEFLLLSCLENRLPLLSFSEKYVETGAFMSVGIDAFDIGSQAGEAALELLSNNSAGLIGEKWPRKAVITVNQKVARKIGLNIDEMLTSEVRIIK